MIQEANLEWRYRDGELILPWYTLPALEWLKKQDVSQWKVFEYGAGYSTIWWRLNCNILISVDNQATWASAMESYFYDDKKQYIELIESCLSDEAYLYDCIIVDGVHREECTEFCLPFLKQGGYLIIDNYDSENYDIDKTVDLLKDWPRTLYAQPNHSQWITAVFQKP